MAVAASGGAVRCLLLRRMAPSPAVLETFSQSSFLAGDGAEAAKSHFLGSLTQHPGARGVSPFHLHSTEAPSTLWHTQTTPGQHDHPGAGALPPGRALQVQAARKKLGFAQLLTSRGPKREVLRPRRRLVKGEVSPRREVPAGIPRPPYAALGKAPGWNEEFQIQSEEGRARMRAAGKLAAQVRDHAGTLVQPGITTDEIDAVVHQMIVDAGAYPSPLNYGHFPKSVCTSVNECVCHGIPDSRPLEDGDIVNIDVTVFLDGYHGDTSKTFLCGSVSPAAEKLVKVTEESLQAAIDICQPGVEFKQIGAVIQSMADKHGYGVVKQFVGHGVGQTFHSGPAVVHCRNNQPGRMQLYQTFTIEPMLTAGSTDVEIWDDDWTAVTADGSLSAQFEHTLLIVENGVEVLTA